ncbi:MAG: 3-hydroxyacyl-ACP dehydratase FabZ [Verrucomicrobiota bacterium]
MNKPLTPHGPGFSFVDGFTPGGTGGGTAWKYLAPESPFFADHFPGAPVMPAVLLAECAAQAAGTVWMHASGHEPGTPLFLASIERFRVKSGVAPGATVRTEVETMRQMGKLAQFEVHCFVDDAEVAAGHLVLSMDNHSASDRSEKADRAPSQSPTAP